MLKLERPLITIDLETTGVDPKLDRIVEFATVRYRPDGGLLSKRRLVKPPMPIPIGASNVHGITDEHVKDAQPFSAFAERLAAHLSECDLAGYNLVSYDVPLLSAEFKRCNIVWPLPGVRIVDALHIFRHKEPQSHTLTAAVKHYLKRDHEGAHGAQADAEATLQVIMAQAATYGASTVDELVALMKDPEWVDSTGKLKWNADGEACVNFGKWSGTPLRQVERGYLQWICKNDFPSDTKAVCLSALRGTYITRPKAEELAS